MMHCHAAITDDADTRQATQTIVQQAQRAMQGRIDLAVVFFTAHHHAEAEQMLETLWLELDPAAIVGCSAEGVIGGGKQFKHRPGLSLLAAEMPGVRVHPFHIAREEAAGLLGDPERLRERLGAGEQTRLVLLLGDPFTTPEAPLLRAFEGICPGVPLIGGMASSDGLPGDDLLVRNDELFEEGAVGVSLSGDVVVDTMVSEDARSLQSELTMRGAANPQQAPAAGLMVNCARRGTAAPEQIDQDLASISRSMPGTAVAGFFASGQCGSLADSRHRQSVVLALLS